MGERADLPTEALGWPDGMVAGALFSFDVDGESWLLASDGRNADLPVTMSQARYGPTVGVQEILALLRRYGVRATFFVPTWTARHHPAAVEMILEDGHEIGLHGDVHEQPSTLDREAELEILNATACELQERTGRRPVGYRAPFGEVSAHTTDLLATVGVEYSSHFMDSFRPYFHRPEGLPAVLELPMHWACDDWLYSMFSPYVLPQPQVNVIRTNEDIVRIWEAEFDAIVERGGLFTLVCHPQITGRPHRLATLEAMLQRATSRDDVWVASGEDINAYIRSRAE